MKSASFGRYGCFWADRVQKFDSNLQSGGSYVGSKRTKIEFDRKRGRVSTAVTSEMQIRGQTVLWGRLHVMLQFCALLVMSLQMRNKAILTIVCILEG